MVLLEVVVVDSIQVVDILRMWSSTTDCTRQRSSGPRAGAWVASSWEEVVLTSQEEEEEEVLDSEEGAGRP